MESIPVYPRRYVGKYPGTIPPRYPMLDCERREPISDKKSILIVDDDPFFRSLFKVMLGQAGLPLSEIREADDSDTTLEICRTSLIDLVFCDLNLTARRSKDGLGIIRDLSLTCPEVPVIMVTADNGEALIRQVCSLGAVGHLLKPVNLRTLKRMLARYLASLASARPEQRHIWGNG